MRCSRSAPFRLVLLAAVVVGCGGGGGPTSPTMPAATMQSVPTVQGPVAVSHTDPLTPSDQDAISREVADGYDRALVQMAQVASIATSSFLITTEGVSSDQNGYYLPEEHRIGVRPDWRAIDHELQHHFCYTLQPPGVDCYVVDHCEGTDLTGRPMSSTAAQCG